MKDYDIIQKAIEEIESKTFGVTKQFLDVHEVVYDGNCPKIERIDKDRDDGTVIAYFPIKDEKFYLAISIDTEPQVSVKGVGTVPYCCVYFRATSEILSFQDLSVMTILKSTGGWSKGDRRKSTTIFRKYSSIHFEPNPEPDEFEDKLKKLLDFLDQDKSGVNSLVERANGYIQVAMEFHNGNTMLGGPHIDKNLMKRMALLNLGIDFDLYANGNLFK